MDVVSHDEISQGRWARGGELQFVAVTRGSFSFHGSYGNVLRVIAAILESIISFYRAFGGEQKFAI